jgi:hypothetical protein
MYAKVMKIEEKAKKIQFVFSQDDSDIRYQF